MATAIALIAGVMIYRLAGAVVRYGRGEPVRISTLVYLAFGPVTLIALLAIHAAVSTRQP